MTSKEQQFLNKLPQELYLDIFKSIQSYPYKFFNRDEFEIDSIDSLSWWREYAIKILTSSKIIYNDFANKAVIIVEMNQLKEELKQFILEQMTEFKKSIETRFDKIESDLTELKADVSQLKADVCWLKNISTFICFPNHWRPHSCCQLNCSLLDNFPGYCASGNGFPLVEVSDLNYPLSISYICSQNGSAFDKLENVYASDTIHTINGKKFYFEIKINMQENTESNVFHIGLSNNEFTLSLVLKKEMDYSCHIECDDGRTSLGTLEFHDQDIFGCCLVFPAINSANKTPYAFFTKNGHLIGRAIILSEDFHDLLPFVSLKKVSIISTNFGQDLSNFPFIYQMFNQTIEYYQDEDWKHNSSNEEVYTSEGSI